MLNDAAISRIQPRMLNNEAVASALLRFNPECSGPQALLPLVAEAFAMTVNTNFTLKKHD